MTEDILTEKIIEMKLNSNKGGKNCNIVNLYIKCNLPKCKLFLDSVESFPIRKNFKKGIIKEENDSETDHEAISL